MFEKLFQWGKDSKTNEKTKIMRHSVARVAVGVRHLDSVFARK